VPEGRSNGDEGGGFDICALQVSDGRILWRSYAGDDVHVTPAAGKGLVVIGSIDEGLRALDSRTGALRWTAPYEGEVWGAPVLANGVVYVRDRSAARGPFRGDRRCALRHGDRDGRRKHVVAGRGQRARLQRFRRGRRPGSEPALGAHAMPGRRLGYDQGTRSGFRAADRRLSPAGNP